MQHEITAPIPLLDEEGRLTEAGFARRPLPVYDRSRVRAAAARIKEWDDYLVMGEGFALALSIADHGYVGMDSISFVHLEERWEASKSVLRPMPLGRTGLPASSLEGNAVTAGKRHGLLFRSTGGLRTLLAHMDGFRDGKPLDARVVLSEQPAESLVVCTPFSKPGQFSLSQSVHCMRAEGSVTVDGRTYLFQKENAFGTLDWGRGVWPHHSAWYRASASGLAAGKPFGLHLVCGLGDSSAATENALFWDGRLHKLGRVTFRLSKAARRGHYLDPWAFVSDDGRLSLRFQPALEWAARAGLGPLSSDQRRVFGRFCGRAALDDGREIPVEELWGFAERVENRW